MLANEISDFLKKEVGDEAVLHLDETSTPPTISVPSSLLLSVADKLYRHPDTYFDFLSCITGLDNGTGESVEVIYHLYSIPFDHKLALRIELDKPADGSLPTVHTVSHIWKTALWHEREAYDLVGIAFQGHPDLRRILLPADWEGHPLRKDYDEQAYYHGIKVAY